MPRRQRLRPTITQAYRLAIIMTITTRRGRNNRVSWCLLSHHHRDPISGGVSWMVEETRFGRTIWSDSRHRRWMEGLEERPCRRRMRRSHRRRWTGVSRLARVPQAPHHALVHHLHEHSTGWACCGVEEPARKGICRVCSGWISRVLGVMMFDFYVRRISGCLLMVVEFRSSCIYFCE